MALVLTITHPRQSKLKSQLLVGETTLSLVDIINPKTAVLFNESEEVVITYHEKTEILPDVWVQVGRNEGDPNKVKPMFTAPREIKIFRKSCLSS